jgi:AraC-like DNA-binding protein
LLSTTSANNPFPKSYLYHRLVKAKLFIDNNYYSAIDLNNIAATAHFSKFHFIRLFKSIYGKSPHQYLIQVRIDQAKELLKQNHSVADTCYKVGFDSITSFSGLFRKSTGTTPSAFQKQYQLRQQKIKTAPLSFIPNCFAEQKGWTRNSNFQELT